METNQALTALSALGQESRLAAFRALVQDQREGRVIRVRAAYAHMDALLAYLTENCCAGAADCGPAPCCTPSTKGTKR